MNERFLQPQLPNQGGQVARALQRLSFPGVLAATATSMGVIAQQVAGKAIRDALFLGNFKAIHLPHAMAAGAVLSLVAVVTLPALTARVSPRRLMPALFVGSAVGFALEWLLFSVTGHGAALALYLHTSVLGPLLISTFWSLINERFDPHSAKRAMATIASGGTIGGLLGGIAVWRASSLIAGPTAVLLLCALSVACAAGALLIPSQAPESRRGAPVSDYADPRAAANLLRTTPLLRNLALLVALSAIISSLLDYVIGVQAVARHGRGAELMSFFSMFGLVVSVLSLLLQVSLGRLAIEKVGLAVHLAVLPAVVALGGAVGLAVPGLASASVLRGAEMVHRNTLFRSAYELLYTPICEAKKRATKAMIDVGFDRIGTFVGSLMTMAIIYTSTRDQKMVLGLVVVVAFAVVPVVFALHFGYVAALKERLLEGAAVLGDADAAPTSVEPDEGARERLIGRAEELLGNAVHGPVRATLDRPRNVLSLGGDLLSGDERRAKAALERLDASTRAAAGHALILLSHPTLHRDARFALRRLAPLITGQLVDLLLAEDVDVLVRRRIPPILAGAPTQRAVDGLLLALSDERFEIRYAAGRTLLRMMGQPVIDIPKERILAILLVEAAREERWADGDDESLSDDATAPLDIMLRDRVSRGLEHVFNLLSCLIDGEAVRLCFRALHQDDNRYRGAALEYLQTALPSEIRDKLWPLLGETSALVPSPRPAAEVLADLTKAIQLTNGEALRPGRGA